jgi:septal ring factor EnvC (AmiA/AmiB activator)
MDATLAAEKKARARASQNYTSPPHALIWSFRKSRDRWKSKHQALKSSLKREKNRVADVTKSREQWRIKAEQARQQVAALEAQIADLRSHLGTCAVEKKRTAIPAR